MGTKEDESNTGRVWAAGFHHVTACSCLAHVLKLKNCLFSHLFLCRCEPRIMNQWIRRHNCTHMDKLTFPPTQFNMRNTQLKQASH
jgi:hypothetical protein